MCSSVDLAPSRLERIYDLFLYTLAQIRPQEEMVYEMDPFHLRPILVPSIPYLSRKEARIDPGFYGDSQYGIFNQSTNPTQISSPARRKLGFLALYSKANSCDVLGPFRYAIDRRIHAPNKLSPSWLAF